MKNDDHMDELLIQAARDYNEPGPVPREEMWARIGEARRATRAEATVQRPAGVRWLWPSIAAAAVLMLSIGIAIGRRIERSASPVRAVASKPAPVAPAPDSSTTPNRAVAAVPTTEDSLISKLHDETRKTSRRVSELAMAHSDSQAPGEQVRSRTEPPRADIGTRRTDEESLAYRLVVLQHLAGSDALITAFRTSAKRGQIDSQLASWSREMLGTTRMLEDSPATSDPIMKRLLQDLDLVITQIVQYTTRGTHDPGELDLIEQSIQRRGIVTKLRSTLPVRTPSAGL